MLASFVGWLACVIACDVLHRRVPNLLVLAGAAGALAALALGNPPLALSWAGALMGATAAFLALLGFYALGLMGAADVKFAAALGLWLGPFPMLCVWVGASLVAVLHGIALLAWRRQTGRTRTRRREIPYAAHMAAVTLGGLLWRHF